MPSGPKGYTDAVFPIRIVIRETPVVGMSFGVAPKPQALVILLKACQSRIASNDLEETIGVVDWSERRQQSHDGPAAAPRHGKFALPEIFKAFSSFDHIVLGKQKIGMPEGKFLSEEKNPLQYEINQQARQLKILIEIDVDTAWKNDRLFYISVVSYYRGPACILHQALLKDAPLIAYAPAKPRLLYFLQLSRPPARSPADVCYHSPGNGIPIARTHPANGSFCL
jgi:hypothetical protein